MKNIADVIEMKEREIVRVRKEIEALRIAAPLLGEEDRSNGAAATTTVKSVLEMPSD